MINCCIIVNVLKIKVNDSKCLLLFCVYLTALVAVVFLDRQESAFAAFRLWQALGFTVMFAISSFYCMILKIYVCLGFCSVGAVFYIMMEIHLRRQAPRPWIDLYEPIST